MTAQITVKLSQALALRDVLSERANPLVVMFVADTTDTTKVSKCIIFFTHGTESIFMFSPASEMPAITAFQSSFPSSIQVQAIVA